MWALVNVYCKNINKKTIVLHTPLFQLDNHTYHGDIVRNRAQICEVLTETYLILFPDPIATPVSVYSVSSSRKLWIVKVCSLSLLAESAPSGPSSSEENLDTRCGWEEVSSMGCTAKEHLRPSI